MLTERKPLIDFKLDILLRGLDCDFKSIKNKKGIENYRVNKLRVSDRHYIDPKSENRKYIPDEILILNSDGYQSIAKVYYNAQSKLLLIYEKKFDQFSIFNKSKRTKYPFRIKLIPLKEFSKKIIKLTNGQEIPVGEIVTPMSVDRLAVNPFDGCAMWRNGMQCSFCGANPKRIIGPKIKPSVTTLDHYKDIEKWWLEQKETVLEIIRGTFKNFDAAEFKPHLHLCITTGYLYGFEWNIILEILKIMSKYIDLKKVDSHLALMPPTSAKQLEIAKKIGIKNIAFNLECFNRKKFEEICKGKNSIVGYDKFRQWLRDAVKIFGRGHVRTNFVFGLENPSELLKGCEELAREGIVSDYTIFYPRPASKLQKTIKKINSKKNIIDFTERLSKIYKKYSFVPFTCNLSSRTSIANDIFEKRNGS